MHPALDVVQLSMHFCKNHILQAGLRFGCEQMQYSYFVGFFFPLSPVRLLYCVNTSLGWLCCHTLQQNWGHICHKITSLPHSCSQGRAVVFPVPPATEDSWGSYCLWEENHCLLQCALPNLVSLTEILPCVPRVPSHAMPACCLQDPS